MTRAEIIAEARRQSKSFGTVILDVNDALLLAAVAEAAVEMRGWLNTGHAYEGGCPDAVEPRSLDPGHCRCCASIVAFDAALRGEGQKP